MIIEPAKRLQTVQEYYFSKKLKEISRMRAAGKAIINLGIGSPDLPPPPQAISALISTAQQTNTHGYQSYIGTPQLREAFALWYAQTYQVQLQADNEILPLMGSKEGILHISTAFLNPGDAVLVPNPGYPTYTSAAHLLQAEVYPYTLTEENNWQPQINEIIKRYDLTKVKLMWLNYPNMPTGADANYHTYKKLIAFAKKYKILLINDNPYSLVLNDQPKSILAVPQAKQVALELNSLSKSHHLAGWRIGMLAGKSDYLTQVLKVKSNMDSGMFLGIQEAAIAALRAPKSWRSEQNRTYAKRRELAEQIMHSLGCKIAPNQVGLFCWAKIPYHQPQATTFSDKILYKAGVFITPGSIFGTAGKAYLRISLCADLATMQKAQQKIVQVLPSLISQ